jgi:hypothetical protein
MFLMLLHDVSQADRHILEGGSFIDYIMVGAKHMLTGYDHLLFLLGVVFFLKAFKDIITFITAFTLGHSLTLLLATYIQLSVNEFLIDAVIGLSVFYKGFENLDLFKKVLKVSPPNLLRMVFLFGLIHGLGLSARLQTMSVESERSFVNIIGFNLGVEFGQVLALIPMVWLVNFWRKRSNFQAFYFAVNTYLLIAGLVLMAIQLVHYFEH